MSETSFKNITGKYNFNSESGVLRIIADDADIASKTVCDQMMETELFPTKFTISAIVYSTKKGGFLTSLIVGEQISKFLNTGLGQKKSKGKSFSEYLAESEQTLNLKTNIIIYDMNHDRFLFCKGKTEGVVFPVSVKIGIKDVPSQMAVSRINNMGLNAERKDIDDLWTYVSDSQKAYNYLVVVSDTFTPKDATKSLEYVWVDTGDIHKVGTQEDVVSLFNVEKKLHHIIDTSREEQPTDYNDIVDKIME